MTVQQLGARSYTFDSYLEARRALWELPLDVEWPSEAPTQPLARITEDCLNLVEAQPNHRQLHTGIQRNPV